MSYIHVGLTGIDLYINFEVFIILYRVSAVTGQSRISGADLFRIWEWEGIKGVNQPGARHRLAQAACSTRAWEEQILFVVKTLIGQSWHFWPFSIWQWSVCGGKNENNQTIWHPLTESTCLFGSRQAPQAPHYQWGTANIVPWKYIFTNYFLPPENPPQGLRKWYQQPVSIW